jgi:hypothetical protein
LAAVAVRLWECPGGNCDGAIRAGLSISGHLLDGRQAKAQQDQFDQYVRQTAGAGGPAAEIERPKRLLDDGTITQAEFETIKSQALGQPA